MYVHIYTLELVHELFSGPTPHSRPIGGFPEQGFVRIHHVARENLELLVRMVDGEGSQLVSQAVQCFHFMPTFEKLKIFLLQQKQTYFLRGYERKKNFPVIFFPTLNPRNNLGYNKILSFLKVKGISELTSILDESSSKGTRLSSELLACLYMTRIQYIIIC